MAKHTYRVVTRARDGSLRIRDFDSEEPILKIHIKVGVDDCSTDLSLRGKPVFRGLVGPMPDGKGVARYESPEVFETLTREWIKAPTKRRRRRTTKKAETETVAKTEESAARAEDESAKILPMPSASPSSQSTELNETDRGAPVAQDTEPPQVASDAAEAPNAFKSATDDESAPADQAKDSVDENVAEPKAEKKIARVKSAQKAETSKPSTIATCGKS